MVEVIALALLSAFAIEATAIAVAITTAIVGIGLTVGASLLAQAFMRPDRPREGLPPSDRQFVSRGSVTARVRSYGRVRLAGAQMFLQATGGSLYRVVAHNHGQIDAIEERLINEVPVAVGGDGWVDTAPWTDNIRWITREGEATQTAYAELTAAFPEWDEDHRGDGICHSLIQFKQVAQSSFFNLYPGGENTTIKLTLRGARVWDPRDVAQDADDDTTWLWTDNAVLIVLDYLRHETGFGMPLEWLEPEIDGWIAAADACDDAVPLAAGGTVPRYRLWGSYGFDERPGDVLARMLTACNGRIWIGPNGGMAIAIGVWAAPTVTLDDDAIVSYRLASGNEAPSTANTIAAAYTDPDQGYVETPAEDWVDAAGVATFGEKKSDARLYMVPHHSQCRRLMKQALARLAPEWRGTISTNLAGLAALTERFVTIQISEVGLDITAEIDDVQFRVDSGNVVTGLTIEWTAMSADAFDFDAATEEGTAAEIPPTLTGSAIPAPVNFAVVIVTASGGAVGQTSWDAFDVVGLRVLVEYRLLGADSWLAAMSSEDATSVETATLIDGETYEFRARSVGLTRQSAHTDTVEIDVVVDAVAPGVPTALSVNNFDPNVGVGWTQPGSANAYGARVYRHTADVPAAATLLGTVYGGPSVPLAYSDNGVPSGTWWWFVAAINGSGVEGTRTLAGTTTIA